MTAPLQGRNWHRDRFIPSDSCIEQKCEECGRSYWLPPSKANLYRTCCRECGLKRMGRDKQARKRNCGVCGKEFTPRAVQVASGVGLFCSQKCNGASKTGENNPFYGKEMTPEQKLRWRETRNKNNSWLIGEANPRWLGGKAAKYERNRASGKARQWTHERRAVLANVKTDDPATPADFKRIGQAQRWKCAVCGTDVKENYHVDHILPLAKGGVHHRHNIQILCPSCNLSKHAKDPIEFMQRKGFLL